MCVCLFFKLCVIPSALVPASMLPMDWSVHQYITSSHHLGGFKCSLFLLTFILSLTKNELVVLNADRTITPQQRVTLLECFALSLVGFSQPLHLPPPYKKSQLENSGKIHEDGATVRHKREWWMGCQKAACKWTEMGWWQMERDQSE